MHILVLNWGSSSVKCSLFAFLGPQDNPIKPLYQDKIEWKNHSQENASSLYAQLKDKQVDCIGHRIVHGGTKFKESVYIDAEVKKELKKLEDLAPLHQKASLNGIKAMESLFPNTPQIAVFDTAFHSTLPPHAYTYPIPHEWSEMGIRRYGFHGISYQYCSKRAAQLLKEMPDKMVICHLGAGASLCALKKGTSIDTTMGFTPLEGLMMDTRSGSIDPGILLYLLNKHQITPETLSKRLYEESGLLGVSGFSSDMRDVLQEAMKGNARAELAIDTYMHRLSAEITSMIASLGGIDTLVFTAGIGENAAIVRERACKQLEFLGIELQDKEGEEEDRIISSANSKVKVLVIHTKEAFEIACECWKKNRIGRHTHQANSCSPSDCDI